MNEDITPAEFGCFMFFVFVAAGALAAIAHVLGFYEAQEFFQIIAAAAFVPAFIMTIVYFLED